MYNILRKLGFEQVGEDLVKVFLNMTIFIHICMTFTDALDLAVAAFHQKR